MIRLIIIDRALDTPGDRRSEVNERQFNSVRSTIVVYKLRGSVEKKKERVILEEWCTVTFFFIFTIIYEQMNIL